MKKKLKKSLACLLAALLIFSAVPMSALADEADTPGSVTVETNAEEAAQDTEPDAEPKPEITAEPTATPEASAKPSTEPTAVPSPEATEEPTEPETSAEPEATAEPTASPTPNPEDEISLLALGDEAVTRYRTVGINGNFSSNYLYDLGEFPLYDIYRNGVSYPAYCLQHGKGRVNNGAYVQRDNFGMTEAMRRIIAYGYNTTNSLGKNDWYSDATAKTMVTQHLVWLASEGYITVDGTNWSWGSGIDNDVERMANLAYNGSVVRSYYAELKDRLLRSEIVPSFAGKNSDGSDAQEIALQLVNGKYAATVTDTNGVLDLFDFQKAGFDISRNGNTLTISASTLPEQETTIIGAGYTVGDKNSIAVWEDKDQQANIQHQATCPGTTQTMAYIKIKGEKPKYTVTLTKTSADVKITNGNANYSLEGAVYYVYKDVNIPDYPYWNYKPYATFTTDANGNAELSKKLESYDEEAALSAKAGHPVMYSLEMLKSVGLGLRGICIGAMSRYFNGHTNIPNSNFIDFCVKDALTTNDNLKNAMFLNIFSYMSHKFLTEGSCDLFVDELHEFVKNRLAITYINSFMKRGRKKESGVCIGSQNVEDLLNPSVITYTKPLMSIPTHSFLFHPGANCDISEFQRTINVQPWEYEIIQTPNRGHCLYKCGAERYHLSVRAPEHKSALFGNAGGR